MEWVVSVTPQLCFIPREGTRGTHCTGGWVGPRAVLDTEARGKSLHLCWESNLDRPVVQLVARHYTDWATRFKTMFISHLFKKSYNCLKLNKLKRKPRMSGRIGQGNNKWVWEYQELNMCSFDKTKHVKIKWYGDLWGSVEGGMIAKWNWVHIHKGHSYTLITISNS
jgi:hypothetical protein